MSKTFRWTDDNRSYSFDYDTTKHGEFSKVFLAESEVMVKTKEGCYDKEILCMVNGNNEYINLPVVERVSWESNLYKMPRYAPITGNKTANAQRRKLQSIWDTVRNNKYNCLSMFDEAVQSSDLPPELKESIEGLINWVGNYGSDEYALEFPPRNVAQDAKGNLILLDVFFKWKR